MFQIAFTIFLDLEALIKIWCLGLKGYFKHSVHKFELLLAIGTTIHIIPQLYMSVFTYFQVIVLFSIVCILKCLEKFTIDIIYGNISYFLGFTHCATNQSISIIRRFCVQDFWTWQETWKSYNFHNVLTHNKLININAVILLSVRIHKV